MRRSESGKSNQLIQADTISRFKPLGWSTSTTCLYFLSVEEKFTQIFFMCVLRNPRAYLITRFLRFHEAEKGVTK